MPQRNKLTESLIELQNFLEKEEIPFMVIGGIANLIWGEPRLTQDIDVTILYSTEDISSFIQTIQAHFRILSNNPIEFAKETKILPIEVSGIRVDIIFAGTEYETIAISRTKKVEIQENVNVRVCSPEDIIIQKVISDRARDWEDIEGILLRQGQGLDRGYILRWLNQFADILDHSDIISRFNRLWESTIQ